MSDLSEIVPCHWCGSKPKVAKYGTDNIRYYRITCKQDTCPVKPATEYLTSLDTLIEKWNSWQKQ